MKLDFGDEFDRKHEQFSHFIGLVNEANKLLRNSKTSLQVKQITVKLRVLFKEFLKRRELDLGTLSKDKIY